MFHIPLIILITVSGNKNSISWTSGLSKSLLILIFSTPQYQCSFPWLFWEAVCVVLGELELLQIIKKENTSKHHKVNISHGVSQRMQQTSENPPKLNPEQRKQCLGDTMLMLRKTKLRNPVKRASMLADDLFISGNLSFNLFILHDFRSFRGSPPRSLAQGIPIHYP